MGMTRFRSILRVHFPENREIIREFLEFCSILAWDEISLCCSYNILHAISCYFRNREFCAPNREIHFGNREFRGFLAARQISKFLGGRIQVLLILLYRFRPICQWPSQSA